ncbi:MAG: cobyrinate a,c-diamide synthase [Clostridiales bacterium]|jgi:cobyrinic acid a,c-diamide synthase|nr:cobyrinate a,c-diamide synthase [Clostridiales bacterium]
MHNRVLLAGTHSGCGKTTITIALLAALRARGLYVASFKCGPDYIDAMFHKSALGVTAHNLDPFFCEPQKLNSILAHYKGKDVSILEGVMGYYDGIACTQWASTYAVAGITKTPVILVADVTGMANSIGAVVKGFVEYGRERHICGVIFNCCPEARYADLCGAVERARVRPLGFLPCNGDNAVKSRHLGLMTAHEVTDLPQKLSRLGALAEKHLDIDGILSLAASAPEVRAQALYREEEKVSARIAVAKDEAFSFCYQENLDLLEALGAEPVFFSPLRDAALPANTGGLYIPGGYPELHAQALGKNKPMLQCIRDSIGQGLPTIAECGGFLYLHDTLDGVPMAGVIGGDAFRTNKPQRFGYMELEANKDTLLCAKGESFFAHEFHYYESDNPGDAFTAHKAGRNKSWPAIHATDTLYAGFPHLYFHTNPKMARHFMRKAAGYAAK